MSEPLVVLCTVPNAPVAETLASALVEARLAACVNVIGGVVSVYRWEGAVQRDDELMLVVKTTREAFAELEARIHALHPYEVPEVIALSIEAGSERYLRWLDAQVLLSAR